MPYGVSSKYVEKFRYHIQDRNLWKSGFSARGVGKLLIDLIYHLLHYFSYKYYFGFFTKVIQKWLITQ